MNIELTTSSRRSALEILDLQVSARRTAGQSVVSLQFLCRNNPVHKHLQMPALSWFDANRLQQFSRQLAAAHYTDTSEVILPDAGLQLIGSVRRLAGAWTTGRTIQIAPLPAASNQFTPFTIHASHPDVKQYARILHSRLWELFQKG